MKKSLMVRDAFKEADDKRDEGLVPLQDVEGVYDIQYGSDPVWQVLDIYRPKGVKEKLPVIVNVHGGGWVYGTKETYLHYCHRLCLNGFAVINFTYRLCPEYIFPSPLEDLNLVVNFILSHGEEYGLDLQNIFGIGDSAGANLVSLYSLMCVSKDYRVNYDFEVPEGFLFKALALNSGDFSVKDNGRVSYLTNCIMKEYLPEHGTDKEFELISVPFNMAKGFPPSYIMTCSGDYLTHQAVLLSSSMMEKSVPHELHFWTEKPGEKPLGHVFHLRVRDSLAQKCNKEECDYFKSFIHS